MSVTLKTRQQDCVLQSSKTIAGGGLTEHCSMWFFKSINTITYEHAFYRENAINANTVPWSLCNRELC